MRTVFAAVALSLLGAGVYATLVRPAAPPPAITDRVDVVARSTARPAGPAVRTDLQETTYPVDGASADAVLRSLLARGPRERGTPFFGLTTAQMELRFDPVERAGACELRGVGVDLALTVRLPTWDAPVGTPLSLRADWRRFSDALRRHEDEHVQIAKRGADAIVQAVEGLRRATCAEADVDVRRRVDQLQAEVEAAHRAYDEETGHGRTEGAVWPQPLR